MWPIEDELAVQGVAREPAEPSGMAERLFARRRLDVRWYEVGGVWCIGVRRLTVAMTGTVTACLRLWEDLRGVWLGEDVTVKVELAEGKLKVGRQSIVEGSGCG